MLKLKDGEVEQYRHSEIGRLVRVLIIQFKHNSSEIIDLNRLFGQPVGRDRVEEIYPEFYDRGIICTVFTGMAIEALLYDFAFEVKSKTFAEKVSQKPLEDELKTIYEEVVKPDCSGIEQLISKLRNLRKTRRYYVHNKSTKVGRNPKETLDMYSCASSLELLYEVAFNVYRWCPNYYLAGLISSSLSEVFEETRGYKIEL